MIIWPNLYIKSLEDAGHMLMSSDGGKLDYVVSIGGLYSTLPLGYEDHPATKLRLTFDDVVKDLPQHGYYGCTEDDIKSLVNFCKGIDGDCLFHCAAGISRSSAACFIFICTRMGPGKEHEAALATLNVKYAISPNARMISMADNLMSRNGEMVKAFCKVFGGKIYGGYFHYS
jgi:predicted protein tyrosine phosphatase